jgi:hypothetical protein
MADMYLTVTTPDTASVVHFRIPLAVQGVMSGMKSPDIGPDVPDPFDDAINTLWNNMESYGVVDSEGAGLFSKLDDAHQAFVLALVEVEQPVVAPEKYFVYCMPNQ